MTGATTGVRVHLYRYRHPDGAEKDWAYPVRLAPNALTVFYGRTGATLRQADTPTLHCRGCHPATEAQARVQEKLAKGYRDLGEFWLAADRRQLTPAAAVRPPAAPASPPAAEPPPPCWYWRWTPGRPPAETARRRVTIETACAAALARLAAVGWTLPDSQPGDDGPALWARLSEAAFNGVLPRRAGNEPQLAFWLLLARGCPDLSLVDDGQQPVSRWPDELPVAAEILETLGLQPPDWRRVLAASGDGEVWFF